MQITSVVTGLIFAVLLQGPYVEIACFNFFSCTLFKLALMFPSFFGYFYCLVIFYKTFIKGFFEIITARKPYSFLIISYLTLKHELPVLARKKYFVESPRRPNFPQTR